MAELLGAAVMLAGCVVALLAAVGIARLPDAFMRMHAATKAGVIATGLCIAGAAIASEETSALIKAGIAIAFLLATTPIASHVLGRAAWRSGAAIAPATRLAPIEREMPQVVFDAFPEFRLARKAASARIPRQEADMNDVVNETKTAAAAGPAFRKAPVLDEVLLAVAWHHGAEIAAGQAAAFAAAGGARLTILSLVDNGAIEAPTAVPLGGLTYARNLARARLAQARDRAAEAARLAAGYADTLGVRPVFRHAEGRPGAEHFACDRGRSLVVMPADSWFDHGVRLDAAQAAAAQSRLDAWPLLLLRGDQPRFERLLFLHDGSAASRASLARFAAHPIAADRDLALAGVGTCSEPALNDAAGLLSGRGRGLEVMGRFSGRARADELAARLGRFDVLVHTHGLIDTSWTSFLGPGIWRIARRTDRSTLLI